MGLTVRELATQSLALLAVAVLLVSALGPMLDHHFAERHPAHAHIYLGAVSLDHSHPFEHSHIHYDAMYAPAPGDEDVAFFTSYEGSGHAHADSASATNAGSLMFKHQGDPYSLKQGEPFAILRGLSVPPLLQPPSA